MKNTDKVTLTVGQLKRLITESNSESILDIIHSLKRYKCPRENMPAFEVEMTIDNIGDRLKDAYEREFGPNSYEKERTEHLAQFWKEPNLKTEAQDNAKRKAEVDKKIDLAQRLNKYYALEYPFEDIEDFYELIYSSKDQNDIEDYLEHYCNTRSSFDKIRLFNPKGIRIDTYYPSRFPRNW